MTKTNVAADALADKAIHQKWVSTYRTPEAQAFYEMAFDEVVQRLDAPPDATILDAGCGSCAKSILLAARGLRVVATDFSPTALRLAEDNIRLHGLENQITLRQGNLLSLPFADGEFRYILCWGVLMHVPDLERALAELARVLAPGGQLVISEGNMHSVQSVALRSARRLLGRGRGRVVRTPAGLESHEQTAEGALVTRQMNMSWLVSESDALGLRLKHRLAGQLSELYVLAPWSGLRKVIHAANRLWFHYVALPGPAFGNILIFEKRRR
jgi:SAM-dependent methyltransferase